MKSFMFFIGVLTASFFGPPRGLVLATQQQNFATISGTGVVVSVYARRPQAEMVVVGDSWETSTLRLPTRHTKLRLQEVH